MADLGSQKETFKNYLDQIRQQVTLLKKQNKDLKRENLRLKDKLEGLQKKQGDIFSEISESERIAMRHQVKSLINKINKHIE
ncbi:hypothetical protein DYD21_04970 [Rhodohalobacter sp. SW132]|uniref:hypothetical protein n=1 Tax=Rhodohalobacter sp. SW132 TaxID=2293433 RepID=UPI000E24DD4F|nr:hypothetical protein [Rhodohalobacter sp. SW132]REL37971.1 hypothetical protein DYD21_04970 [Rhodohalobacter sp. SW132]